jgi:predicted RNase H-like nuclease
MDALCAGYPALAWERRGEPSMVVLGDTLPAHLVFVNAIPTPPVRAYRFGNRLAVERG